MNHTIEILKDLIRIPSFVDNNHNENKVAEYILDFIKENTNYKYTTQIVSENRKNLIICNKKNPKVLLFGHMDTVLPKAETDEPFNPKIVKNKIYGLGSVDMKSGLAIMLNLAKKFNNDELAFVFSVDEEYEFKGGLKLREINNINPEFIINVEPTDNKILNGCRGITEFSFIAHGKSVHAGRKKYGINAIEKSVKLIKILEKELSKFDTQDNGKTSINLAYLHGGTLQDDNSKEIKISKLGMVVPNYSEINCEIRIASPKITQKLIQDKIIEISKVLKINITNLEFKFYLGSMSTPKSKIKSFEKSISDVRQKIKYADISSTGYYEIQLLQNNWGGNGVIFGPGPINLSHSANEYADINSIKKTEMILSQFIRTKINDKS